MRSRDQSSSLLTEARGSDRSAGVILSRVVFSLSLLFSLLPASGDEKTTGDSIHSVVRFFSHELRKTENRLQEIAREIQKLPKLKDHPWGSRYGHRSADLPNEHTADWLQMDMRWQRKIDMIALMPAHLSYRGKNGAGYGFPERFCIEVSDHADMRDAKVLVDRSQADVPNPGRYPMVFAISPVTGRYLRFTSLKHRYTDDAYFWAMEEILVLEGNKLASSGAEISVSSSMDLYPQWVPVRINDGQSSLGMPVDVMEPSPTQGYLSDKSSKKEAEAPIPRDLKKWCFVDLGAAEEIQEVRLLPLESDAHEVMGGRGFPGEVTIQLANDPDFRDISWQSTRGGFPLGYPDGCAIHFTVPKIKARYVRLLADKLWSRDNWYVFGLAEWQVYGSDRNLALGKTVLARDVTDNSPSEDWSPAHLVDGYTSRYRLIDWSEFLSLIVQRGKLVAETDALEKRKVAIYGLGKKLISVSVASLFVLIISASVWSMARHRAIRRRDVEQLRQQIARDLHDDIGSNLGGIVLLSEIGSEHSRDDESREDFKTIRRAAEEASISMRDIVWLIQREPVGLKEFVTRMRQSLRAILNSPEASMEVVPSKFHDRSLSLLFRRHVFLAFKETLNNVRKHAQTSTATVKVEIHANRFRFIVSDQGVGFDPDQVVGSGHGLDNLRRRASRTSGCVSIESAPGAGSKVIFEAPFSA